MIKGLLFVLVIVVLVLRRGMRTIKTLRLERVLVSGQKGGSEPIDGWSPRFRHETRFSRQICGHRIGCEIVVERNVLLEDDHKVLNRIGCFGAVLTLLCGPLPAGDMGQGSGNSDCR